MMDIGWSELLLIGIVALIVVGPKDLPVMFRTLGRFTAKARAMGREFQRAMDEAAKETGVNETAKDLKALTSKKNLGLDALDRAASNFEKWDPTKSSTKPKGPATQALADKQAAERTERALAAADAGKAAAPAKQAAKVSAKAGTPKGTTAKAAPAKTAAAAKQKTAKAPAKSGATSKDTKASAPAAAKAKAAPKPRGKTSTG
jgi:sec-independent protein translocase protein TatB